MRPQAKCLRNKINKGRLFRSLDMLFLRHRSTEKSWISADPEIF